MRGTTPFWHPFRAQRPGRAKALSLYLNVLPPTTWWHRLSPAIWLWGRVGRVGWGVLGSSMAPCGGIISSFIDPIYVTSENYALASILDGQHVDS